MPIGDKNTAIPGGGLHHIAIQARDWDESLRFYRDILGMEPVLEFGSPERKIVLFDMGDGSHIELFQATSESPATPAENNDPVMHFALTTTDTYAATERVRQAGYEITIEPKDADIGISVTLSFCKGPNGEIVEFFQVNG